MGKPNKFYQLEQSGSDVDITIYGDITSYAWPELGEMSAYTLSKQIENLNAENINVNINSYGGEVAEGLAIYNALRRHKAHVTTRVDGFACSIASVIFMAGDERMMNDASLLMIHNAWQTVQGNSDELRKAADDLDIITDASVRAYMSAVTISERKVRELMAAETWISPADAVKWGFATSIENSTRGDNPSQSVRNAVMQALVTPYQATSDDDEDKDTSKCETDATDDSSGSEDDSGDDSTGSDQNSDDSGDNSGENGENSTENDENNDESDDKTEEKADFCAMQAAFFNAIFH